MPPLRRRDERTHSSSPIIQRRIARGLSINVPLANQAEHEPVQTIRPAMDELEIALAAKQVELVMLLSPTNPIDVKRRAKIAGPSALPVPCQLRIVDSQKSFLQMKTDFMEYLERERLMHLIPESKLYHAIYLPYG